MNASLISTALFFEIMRKNRGFVENLQYLDYYRSVAETESLTNPINLERYLNTIWRIMP